MKLSDITEDDIWDIADSGSIVERGRRYYRTRRITSFHTSNNIIVARVLGSYGTYDIEVHIDDGEIVADCNCPYGGPGCKHVAAVLYKYISEYEEKEKERPRKSQKKQQSQFFSLLDTLQNIPVNQDKQEEKYMVFFRFAKEQNNLCLSVEKAQYLKSGELGKKTKCTKQILIDSLPIFSEKKRRACLLFLHSLVTSPSSFYSIYSAYAQLVKRNLTTEADMELLRILRELFLSEPESFSNAFFKEKITEVSLEFKSNQKKKDTYMFEFFVMLGGNKQPLNPKSVHFFGDTALWCWQEMPEQEKNLLFECKTNSPTFFKQLFSYSGTVLTKKELHAFIESYYVKLSQVMHISLPKQHSIIEKIGEPIPRLLLRDFGSDTISVELKFRYDQHEVSPSNGGDIVFTDEAKRVFRLQRDSEKEQEYRVLLLENHLTEKDGFFFPTLDPRTWIADTVTVLQTQGFEIFGSEWLKNIQLRRELPQIKIEVSSGIDWFDIKGSVTVGDEEVPFESVLGALTKHERFIKLKDGTTAVLPKHWFEKLAGVAGLIAYDAKQRCARASKAQISLVHALLDISSSAKVDEKFEKIKEKFQNFKQIKEIPLPAQFQGTLREYQKAGYNWLHFLQEFSFGGCLADEMGLGKTVQVLSMLLYEKEKGNTQSSLIIVPKSLVFNWVNEINKFTPNLTVSVHHGLDRAQKREELNLQTDIIITTYGTLRNDIDLFQNILFYYIVLDESQYIKNALSQVAKTAYSLKGSYRLALTGTPIENNSLELWSQFAFLNPGLLGDMNYFKSSFTRSIEQEKNKDKASALKNMIHPFLLLRKKEMVAQDLPEKQITILYNDMETEQRRIYDYWKDKIREEVLQEIQENGVNKAQMKILQGLTLLRQICNHPLLIDESYLGESGKFSLIVEQLEEIIAEGHKVLLFSSFVKMLHLFRNKFIQKKIRFSYLDGSTNNRKEVVEEFQADPTIPVFLISLKAGGLGLNLTAADYVFIVDPWWNPAAEAQAIDRAHRIGQTKNVFVYKLITKDSIEEKIVELQESKKELVENVIPTDDGIFKRLTEEHIKKLFL